MPALNPFARQNAVLLVVLLVAQLLLASSSARRSSRTSTAQSLLMRIGSPGVALADGISGAVRGVVGELRDVLSARARNVVLEAEAERLARELVRYREAAHENARLRQLLGMREVLAPESIAATVVTSNLTGQNRMVVIDRGTRDGVRPDMPVVAWGGAIGKVLVSGRRHSKVRLLNDLDSGVLGAVQRSRVRGVVQGRPDGGLDMLYVPRFADVMHDDRVVTSGLDGVFPRGFGIGRVSGVTDHADGTQTIHLEPEVEYASVEEVLVLVATEPGGLDGAEDPETP